MCRIRSSIFASALLLPIRASGQHARAAPLACPIGLDTLLVEGRLRDAPPAPAIALADSLHVLVEAAPLMRLAGTPRRPADTCAARGVEFVTPGMLAAALGVPVRFAREELTITLDDPAALLPASQHARRLAAARRPAPAQGGAAERDRRTVRASRWFNGATVGYEASLDGATALPVRIATMLSLPLAGGGLSLASAVGDAPGAGLSSMLWVAAPTHGPLRQVQLGQITVGAQPVTGIAASTLALGESPRQDATPLRERVESHAVVEWYLDGSRVATDVADDSGWTRQLLPLHAGDNAVTLIAYPEHAPVHQVRRQFWRPPDHPSHMPPSLTIASGRCRTVVCQVATSLEGSAPLTRDVGVVATAILTRAGSGPTSLRAAALVTAQMSPRVAASARVAAGAPAVAADVAASATTHVRVALGDADRPALLPGGGQQQLPARVAVLWHSHPGTGAAWWSALDAATSLRPLGHGARVTATTGVVYGRLEARQSVAISDGPARRVAARADVGIMSLPLPWWLPARVTSLRSSLTRDDYSAGAGVSLRIMIPRVSWVDLAATRDLRTGRTAVSVRIEPLLEVTRIQTLASGGAGGRHQISSVLHGTLGLRTDGSTTADGKLSASVAVVSGTVFHDRNANGNHDRGEEPLAGIRVTGGGISTVSDRRGKYALRPLAPFTAVVVRIDTAALLPAARAPLASAFRVTPGPGAQLRLDLPVVDAPSVAGRIGGDASISGALPLELCAVPGGPCRGFTTFMDGTFSVPAVPPGNYRIALPDSVARAMQVVADPVAVTVALGENLETEPVMIVIRPARAAKSGRPLL